MISCDANGRITVQTLLDYINGLGVSNTKRFDITATDGQTEFVLLENINKASVFLNGVLVNPTDYSINEFTLTLVNPASAGDELTIFNSIGFTSQVPGTSVTKVAKIDDLTTVSYEYFQTCIVTEEGKSGVFNYDPNRVTENDGMFVIDGWVRQVEGIDKYYLSKKYVVNDIVIASDGKFYRSLTGDEMTLNIGNNPLTDTVNWRQLSADEILYDNSGLGLSSTDVKSALDELNAIKAQLNGNNTIRFEVAAAVNDEEALNKGQLLAEIKVVDGPGSGLDADLVRGLPADFTSSKTTNGYQKLPSGLIIQWGKVTPDSIPAGSTLTVTYPIAFPNNTLTTIVSSNSRSDYIVSTGLYGSELAFNATSFIIQAEGGIKNGANWIAIGY